MPILNPEKVLMEEFGLTAEQSDKLCQHFGVSTAIECFELLENRLSDFPDTRNINPTN